MYQSSNFRLDIGFPMVYGPLMSAKSILLGLLAVIVFFGSAFLLIVWTLWATHLDSKFWSLALSPIGALVLGMVVAVFLVGSGEFKL